MRFDRDHGPYPARLRAMPDPPAIVSTTGPLREDRRVVAIVGSRDATAESQAFAHRLAFALAREGAVVVSGGAVGVDAAAHGGALAAGGATWAVLPCGRSTTSPAANAALFAEIAGSREGRLVWPFADDVNAGPERFRYRNGVLTALADEVVVVQAHYKSGSLNAAGWARSFGRRVWMVPAPPWAARFCGTNAWLEQGNARPLWAPSVFLRTVLGRDDVTWDELAPEEVPPMATLGLDPAPDPTVGLVPKRRRAPRRKAPQPAPRVPRSPEESAVISALCAEPRHLDTVALLAGLGPSAAVTALLTLALEDVVVEGPDGFFRLQNAG